MLGEEPVTDTDIALWSPSDNNRLTVVLVVVDLPRGGASEDLEFELVFAIFFVDVQALLQVDLLLLLLVVDWLYVLLDVSVAVEQGVSDDVHHDVGLANVDQHVVFQHL